MKELGEDYTNPYEDYDENEYSEEDEYSDCEDNYEENEQ